MLHQFKQNLAKGRGCSQMNNLTIRKLVPAFGGAILPGLHSDSLRHVLPSFPLVEYPLGIYKFSPRLHILELR